MMVITDDCVFIMSENNVLLGVSRQNQWCRWCNNEHGQVDAPDGTFTAVSAGRDYSCGLNTDATITCWGDNRYILGDPLGGTFGPVGGSGPHATP